VAGTVLGAMVLSVRGQSNRLAELPIPTVAVTELVFLTPTSTATPVIEPGVTVPPTIVQSPSFTPTPPPTPTVCPLPPEWQRYVVGAFDTFVSIAQRFSLTPDQLMRANCLSQPIVKTGDTVFVPPFRATPTIILSCAPRFNWMPYIVAPGDTLSAIAARYGTSVVALMQANCLASSMIYAGQRLFVPPVPPIVTFTSTPIVPTLTPTPPIVTLTPTATPPIDITPTPTLDITTTPATPIVTVTPTEIVVPTDTPPADTPTPEATVMPTVEPSATPAPALPPEPTATTNP
jgi:LysM repeat protein